MCAISWALLPVQAPEQCMPLLCLPLQVVAFKATCLTFPLEQHPLESTCLDLVGNTLWWFGGGCDLTPTYLNQEDAGPFSQDSQGGM